MSKGTVIGFRNWVIGCILYPIVVWILNTIFGPISDVAVGATGVVVMTVMVLETGSEAFNAGMKAHAREQSDGIVERDKASR